MKGYSAVSIGFGVVVGASVVGSDVKAANITATEPDDSVYDSCANFTEFNWEELVGAVNYSFAGFPGCTGPVIEYQDEDERFPDFVYPSNGQDLTQALSILFYAPWCTAIAFNGMKSKYVEFASDVTKALLDSPVGSVEPVAPLFYTISCEAHVDICNDQGIEGYPTLMLFPPGQGRLSSPDYRSNTIRVDLYLSCFSEEGIEELFEQKCSDRGGCSNETLESWWLRYEGAYESAVATTVDMFRVETSDLQEASSSSEGVIGANDAGMGHEDEDGSDPEETNTEAALDGLEEDYFIEQASSASAALSSAVACFALMAFAVALA